MSWPKEWEEHFKKLNLEADVVIPISFITDPPCKICACFKPAITTNSHGQYDGIIICNRGIDDDDVHNDMCGDFSCYEPKEGKEG